MKNSAREIGEGFTIEDILNNGRMMLKIPSSIVVRDNLSCLDMNYSSGFIDLDYFRKKVEILGVNVIDNSYNYNRRGLYDCRDWAFDEVGLPQYTGRDGGGTADELMHNDLPGLSWVLPTPVEKSIVMYFDGDYPVHWGVVVGGNGKIFINSKWGDGDVYCHPLEIVPSFYGDYVGFFRIDA